MWNATQQKGIISQISVSLAWFVRSQASNAASLLKVLIFFGFGTTGAIIGSGRKAEGYFPA